MIPGFGIGKAADDRVGSCEPHLFKNVVRRDVVIYIAKVLPGQRVSEQTNLFHRLLVVLIGQLAIEVYGIGIFHHLTREHDGLQSVALELERQQLPGRYLQGCKETDVGIGEHLHLACLYVNLPEIRDARIVRATNQVLVIQREAELS